MGLVGCQVCVRGMIKEAEFFALDHDVFPGDTVETNLHCIHNDLVLPAGKPACARLSNGVRKRHLDVS